MLESEGKKSIREKHVRDFIIFKARETYEAIAEEDEFHSCNGAGRRIFWHGLKYEFCQHEETRTGFRLLW